MPSGSTRGNRDRLLAGDLAARFLATVLAQTGVEALLLGELQAVDAKRDYLDDADLAWDEEGG